MTREEAIYQLEDLKKEAMSHFWCEKDDCANDDKIHHRDAEALDMAIAALFRGLRACPLAPMVGLVNSLRKIR